MSNAPNVPRVQASFASHETGPMVVAVDDVVRVVARQDHHLLALANAYDHAFATCAPRHSRLFLDRLASHWARFPHSEDPLASVVMPALTDFFERTPSVHPVDDLDTDPVLTFAVCIVMPRSVSLISVGAESLECSHPGIAPIRVPPPVASSSKHLFAPTVGRADFTRVVAERHRLLPGTHVHMRSMRLAHDNGDRKSDLYHATRAGLDAAGGAFVAAIEYSHGPHRHPPTVSLSQGPLPDGILFVDTTWSLYSSAAWTVLLRALGDEEDPPPVHVASNPSAEGWMQLGIRLPRAVGETFWIARGVVIASFLGPSGDVTLGDVVSANCRTWRAAISSAEPP
jgi:hypothetical protein